MKKKLILTCSLCSNYDPNRSLCNISGEKVYAASDEFATQCRKEGYFVRNMNVLPDAYNYFSVNEEIPHNWKMDLSKLPKDKNGLPLFVSTKRGIERAIPANDSVSLEADIILGVPRIQTYQGQRELIFELGVDLARQEAEKEGVELTVLPEETGAQGHEEYQKEYEWRQNSNEEHNDFYWFNDKSEEGWD